MKVLFSQPAQFNRTKQKTNPFFDPLIAVCEKNKKHYRIVEMSKDTSTSGYKNVLSSHFLTYFDILGCRLINKWFHFPARPVWLILGFIANFITFGRYRADIYITVAGVHMGLLQGINPKARLVDLQHGVIYSTHSGYFTENRLLQACLAENPQREYWLYGEGYRRCFFMHPENEALLKNKVHIVGDVLGVSREQMSVNTDTVKDAIVFSLQLTPDFNEEELQQLCHLYESAFEKINAEGLYKQYKVLVKHHPRYANCVDVSTWQQRFPWLEWSASQTNDLIARAIYHVTIDSTTAFEYAAEGVPTWFLVDPSLPYAAKSLMIGEYAYDGEGSFEEMIAYLNTEDRTILSTKVKAWYERFYTPFNEATCLKLLQGVMIEH